MISLTVFRMASSPPCLVEIIPWHHLQQASTPVLLDHLLPSKHINRTSTLNHTVHTHPALVTPWIWQSSVMAKSPLPTHPTHLSNLSRLTRLQCPASRTARLSQRRRAALQCYSRMARTSCWMKLRRARRKTLRKKLTRRVPYRIGREHRT